MRQINFNAVGVPVKSMKELYELYLTYSALDIPFLDDFIAVCEEAQQCNLTGWFIQCTDGTIGTKINVDDLVISIINYPIEYSMESLDFAIACQLLMSNQEAELKVHLAQHCKEFK